MKILIFSIFFFFLSFRRRKYICMAIDETWQIDLTPLEKLKRYNKGYNQLLIAVDTFSKYMFARALKSKRSVEVMEAFRDIIEESGRKPKLLHHDEGKKKVIIFSFVIIIIIMLIFLGTEFYGTPFKNFCKMQNIKQYHTYSDLKAMIVERLNR
jgi:hypothetical protein